jgi:hypothetical protein
VGVKVSNSRDYLLHCGYCWLGLIYFDLKLGLIYSEVAEIAMSFRYVTQYIEQNHR